MSLFPESRNKIREAIINTFRKNGNQPLYREELFEIISLELGNNGDTVDEEIFNIIIEIMLDRFTLLEEPSSKIRLNE